MPNVTVDEKALRNIVARRRSMTGKELLQALRKAGIEIKRISGSHAICTNPNDPSRLASFHMLSRENSPKHVSNIVGSLLGAQPRA